jgi:recombination protein RecA
MARKRKDTKSTSLDMTGKSIQDMFNESMREEFEIDDTPCAVIPTGIELLDAVLGGGVAAHLVQILGNPGSSKSTLACKILAESEKNFKEKFLSLYIDSEQSMSKNRLKDLGMQNPSEIFSTRVTVESILKTVEKACLVKSNVNDDIVLQTPSVIVWDSVANTLTEKGFEADSIDSVLGEKARVLSSRLPKVTDFLKAYNICLLAINQLRENIQIGPVRKQNELKYLFDKSVPGGNAILFNSYQIIYLQHGKEVTAEPDGNKLNLGFNGSVIRAKTIKNKSFTPNIDIEMVMSFNRGYSNFWTNFLLLKKFDRIVTSGAWSTLRGCEENKFYQKDAIKLYSENEKYRSIFNDSVKEVIAEEYVEKYKSVDENIETSDELIEEMVKEQEELAIENALKAETVF